MPGTSLFTDAEKKAIQQKSAANLASCKNGGNLPYVQTLDVVLIGSGFDQAITNRMFVQENTNLQIGVMSVERGSVFSHDTLKLSSGAGDRAEFEGAIRTMTGKSWDVVYDLPPSEVLRDTATVRPTLDQLRAAWIDVSKANWQDLGDWKLGPDSPEDGPDHSPDHTPHDSHGGDHEPEHHEHSHDH